MAGHRYDVDTPRRAHDASPAPVKAAPRPPSVASVLALQRTAGNGATGAALAGAAPRLVVQRVVDPGLPSGTGVTYQGRAGRILREDAEQGRYEVGFRTVAQPPLEYSAFVPYAELDAAPEEEHVDEEEGEEEYSEEEAFDGSIDRLPETVTLGGIDLRWAASGDKWLLQPAGRQYPHLTVLSVEHLGRLHFTSAAYDAERDRVSVVRRGYRWNGMHQRLQADPEFDQAEQFLAPTAHAGGVVTFDLSGGRRGQRIADDAAHIATPSVAELAEALGIPS